MRVYPEEPGQGALGVTVGEVLGQTGSRTADAQTLHAHGDGVFATAQASADSLQVEPSREPRQGHFFVWGPGPLADSGGRSPIPDLTNRAADINIHGIWP